MFVAAPSIDAVAEAMAVHLDFQGIDRQELFEVRCALEVATVDLAATSFDARRVEQLEAMLEAERAAQIEVVGQASHAWHGMIAELTGNRAVLLFILVLIRLTEERGGVPSQESAELVWRAHDTIMRAIAEQDPERACRRMAPPDAITPTSAEVDPQPCWATAGDTETAARDHDVLEATLAGCVTAELLDTIAGAGPPPDSRARPSA